MARLLEARSNFLHGRLERDVDDVAEERAPEERERAAQPRHLSHQQTARYRRAALGEGETSEPEGPAPFRPHALDGAVRDGLEETRGAAVNCEVVQADIDPGERHHRERRDLLDGLAGL